MSLALRWLDAAHEQLQTLTTVPLVEIEPES
jgi:hypothetical protein